MVQKKGRHTAAFLLILLAEGPAYGHQLLTRLQNELPFFLTDSPSVYRSLQEMEERGWLEACWETENSGQPRKWYHITEQGIEVLHGETQDILRRQANFNFFLTRYLTLFPNRESKL
ncbi:MAG: PadR family transcriptional regulator [Desulfitobacterium hafniense]|nr:PadR family transcriptional regulator [Desulfitobacterium hafniense]